MNTETGRMCTIILILVTGLWSQVDGSAIPMWEFLSKNEKVSHLYRLFSKEVASYCLDSSMPDCNKNLLVSGLRHLSNMDENKLDELDPYQRNANFKIWRTLVGNYQQNSRTDHESTGNNAGDDPLVSGESDQNSLAEESSLTKDYVKPIDHESYVVGPLVVRVFPDGRPVPGDDQRPLPRDEDLDDLKYSRVPSVSELQASYDRFPLKKYNSPQANLLGYPFRVLRFVRPVQNYYGTSIFPDRHKPEMKYLRFY
ncbi:rhythmically expressed gene 5 protein [Chelonus insularis]|uniref:rhythmically expressed gene 5 protein n=1 Tax=Chelonus insularis TaxID=460826 RepID=UPI0015889C17|nr:rhythmically expressed gene 5 protein [Chelonus insularis]